MKAHIFLICAVVVVVSNPLLSEQWPVPTPRVFGSPWGNHGFKLLKPEFGGNSEGVLFRLDAEGVEQVIWQAKLVNTPHQVIVDDEGKYVATIDTYGILGHAHSLVIYGNHGQVIRDFRLEDLLTTEEIASQTNHSESSRVWAHQAHTDIEREHLVLRLRWGKTIRVDLSSGKLLDAPHSGGGENTPGLIGTAHKDGEATRIAYHYPHGKVFPPALIREPFHDGELNRPAVQIELVGYVEVPEDMAVDIYHAAGGVNLDHGTLYIDQRKIGQVGDDMAKFVIYTLTLPEGTHHVRWVLTGGTFQANLLRMQNAKTGELLKMFYTPAQREQTGAGQAVKTIEAQGEVAGWPPDFKTWSRLPIKGSDLFSEPDPTGKR